MVGHEAFARAMVHARGPAMCTTSSFDDQALVISGRVKGTYRDDYAVTVYLASSRSGAVTAYRSQCSCPVALDCKHAAAVLIVARHLATAAQALERPEWEKTLDKLMAGVPARGGRHRAAGAGVRGRADPGVPRLRRPAGPADPARPARQGRSTGCGAGSAGTTWTSSPGPTCPSTASCCCSSAPPPGSSARYALPRSAWLSLSTVGSGFWGLLDQTATDRPEPDHRSAAARAAPHPRSRPQVQPGYRTVARTGDLRLASTRAGRGTGRWRAGTVGVLGEPAHGVFWVQPGATGTEDLYLARLDQLLGRELRHLLVEKRRHRGSGGRRGPLLDRLRAAAAPEGPAGVERRFGPAARGGPARRWP